MKSFIKKPQEKRFRWVWIIVFLVFLFLLASIFTSCIALFSKGSFEPIASGNVAFIRIQGPIASSGDATFFGDQVASSDSIVELLEQAEQNREVKAILLEINSPGGTAVASEEIAHKLAQSNKTTVSYIRDVGASGAYWVASSTDKIYASRMSITGSVGVIASYLEFSGLLQKYNVTYQRMVAGDQKDIGSPFRKLSKTEEKLLQDQLDEIHTFFLEEVKQNRKLSQKQEAEISTGVFFLGSKAKELNLIDEIGGKEEAIAYLEQELNEEVMLAEYKEETTLLDLLSKLMYENSFFVGQGIAAYMTQHPDQPRMQILT